MIAFNTEDLKTWKTLLKKAPGYIRAVSASVLNNQGYRLMQLQNIELTEHMKVRNKTIVKHALKVEKTKAQTAMSQQVVHVGSVAEKNFTGWKENVATGGQSRAKTILLMARGGNPDKVVSQKARAKQDNIMTAAKLGLPLHGGQKTFGMMAILAEMHYTGLFVLQGSQFDGTKLYQLEPGGGTYLMNRKAYGRRPGKPYVLPRFHVVQDTKKPTTIKHANPWIARAMDKLLAGTEFARDWAEGLANAFKMAKKAGKL